MTPDRWMQRQCPTAMAEILTWKKTCSGQVAASITRAQAAHQCEKPPHCLTSSGGRRRRTHGGDLSSQTDRACGCPKSGARCGGRGCASFAARPSSDSRTHVIRHRGDRREQSSRERAIHTAESARSHEPHGDTAHFMPQRPSPTFAHVTTRRHGNTEKLCPTPNVRVPTVILLVHTRPKYNQAS